MIDKTIEALEPFALTLVIIAGANLAGWITFSNRQTVGYVVVFVGILLTVKHVAARIKVKK